MSARLLSLQSAKTVPHHFESSWWLMAGRDDGDADDHLHALFNDDDDDDQHRSYPSPPAKRLKRGKCAVMWLPLGNAPFALACAPASNGYGARSEVALVDICMSGFATAPRSAYLCLTGLLCSPCVILSVDFYSLSLVLSPSREDFQRQNNMSTEKEIHSL